MLLDTLEEWLSLIIGLVFVGFVFLVIALIFRSPALWLFLGLLAALLFFFPIVRTLRAMTNRQRSRQRQDYKLERQTSALPDNKQTQQLTTSSKQRPKTPEVKKPSMDDPEVQTYVPPGLPPDLFL